MIKATASEISAHGLTNEEYTKIIAILGGREPNAIELGIFSVMWSEHCSYKSSKKWLKTLPTKASWVICGPGENAGVIDIGDGLAAIFKMESHNHPSYIEPFQGAATGVGGILRDVFTMGARPIANLNALRFGGIDHPKTRHLLAGVVEGIAAYGNCVGVPTVGGEVNFHDAFNGNILVNAMTVGLAQKDRIFYSAASGYGNPVIYVGSKTGRDGIHGATMASAEFDAHTEEKRPTVQVGDPFIEKLLIEACLELMATDNIIAIQDMGAAGLTCSSFEMCSKGNTGIELNLDNIPTREKDMSAYEIMLSESQERMLMVLKPGSESEAQKIFEKWELDFAVVGEITNTGRMILLQENEIVADLPIDPLAEASPEYDRPWLPSIKKKILAPNKLNSQTWADSLKKMVCSPDLASRRWIWEQYDHMVMGDTVQRPGGDAAIIRIHNSNRGLAMTTDCTPRYVNADPLEGGRQAVAEAYRNLSAVGARPLAITDNLNFGNPEKPEIMGQLVQAIQGIGEACKVLDCPVVSGNVSLYNETDGKSILPTPAIGAIGIIDSLDQTTTSFFKAENEDIVLLGDNNNYKTGWVGQSLYARVVHKIEDGAPPPVDLNHEKAMGAAVRKLIKDSTVTSCHDVADGGLLITVLEMALSTNIGFKLSIPEPISLSWLFGEDQGRYIITCKKETTKTVIQYFKDIELSAHLIGQTGGDKVQINGDQCISLEILNTLHEDWLPTYMAA